MKKNYSETFPNLYHFFAGYFPHGLGEIYVWGENEPQYQGIVRKLKTEISRDDLEKTIEQLRNVMEIGRVLTKNLGQIY